MTRILLVGDLHGDISALKAVCSASKDLYCNAVLQLGDWGFLWPFKNMHEEAKRVVKDSDTRFIFIDGNHDWHDGIRAAYPSQHYYLPDIQPGEMVYLDRGRVLTPEFGTKILGCGGAGSVDMASRTPGKSWFSTEAIERTTVGDIAELVRIEGCVLACHDTPRIIDDLLPGHRWPAAALRACETSRDVLRDVIAEAKPSLIVHGHMHYNATYEYKGAAVRALAHAQHSGGLSAYTAVLNLDGPSTWLENVK